MRPRESGATRLRRVANREVHLRDLAAVIFRHWRVVLLLTVLVSWGAYFSGRQAIERFRSRLTVQVSSPKQVFTQLEDRTLDELALKTDPILSEALVLTTQRLALRVVGALGLSLEVADPRIRRADVLHDVRVDSLARPGLYQLSRNDAGWALRDSAGRDLGRGSYDQPALAPGFSFRALPVNGGEQAVDLRVIRPEEAASLVSGGLAYEVREGTNAVDISFTGADPTMVPLILNQAALELRLDGTRRAKELAVRRREYIAGQLSEAQRSLQNKLRELQQYKELQSIADLSVEEQAIVTAVQTAEQERQRVLVQTNTIRDAFGPGDSIGIENLNRLAAIEGIGDNAVLAFQIRNLLERYDERRALTAGSLGLRENNPQVSALDQRIRHGHAALRTAVEAAVRSLSGRLEELDRNLADLRARLRTFPGMENRISQLQLESAILNDTYKFLLSQHQASELQENTITPYVTLLDGASPAVSISTTLRQKILLGVLVGLLLGLAGAFFLEYLDQTIKTAADIERAIGIPVLGLIPDEAKLSASDRGKYRPIVPISQLAPDDPATEAYRALRTNVTFVGAEKPLQFIAVTSPGPGEGKTTTAANLAVTLAQGGSRTLLIDGDLRRPLIHLGFDLVQEPGLTDLLVARSTPREAVRPQVLPGLDILPSGPTPPNPSELLGSQAMQALIGELRRSYDYIVMDTPPTLPVTDAAVVATLADAVILVVRSGDTEEISAQRAVEQLGRVSARIAGAVLNGLNRRSGQQYTYYTYRRDRGARSPVRSLRSRLAGKL